MNIFAALNYLIDKGIVNDIISDYINSSEKYTDIDILGDSFGDQNV